MKICKHVDKQTGEEERCQQPVAYTVDKSITKREEWLTGRNIPWNDIPEVIMQPCHPIVPLDLCYYHLKFKKNEDKS